MIEEIFKNWHTIIQQEWKILSIKVHIGVRGVIQCKYAYLAYTKPWVNLQHHTYRHTKIKTIHIVNILGFVGHIESPLHTYSLKLQKKSLACGP
jgi:hypothetical protein